MNFKDSSNFFIVTIIVLVLISAYFISLNVEKANQISLLEEQVSTQSEQIDLQSKQIQELTAEVSNLSAELRWSETQVGVLEDEAERVESEVEDLFVEIDNYQTQIEDSLEWYKINSILGDNQEQNSIKSRIDNECVDSGGSFCNINIGCFYLLNREYFDFNYYYDSSLYESVDKLGSLQDFIDNKGGDCEDYSLFVKAEYNYALEQCENKDLKIITWEVPEEPTSSIFYLNDRRSWYLEGVSKVDVSNNPYPNIICGILTEPDPFGNVGHCMLAFSEEKIITVSDLHKLSGAAIVEPQDGSYWGRVNEPSSEIYLLDKNNYEEDIEYFIFTVITDEDFFQFNENTLEWNSYENYYESLENHKDKIQNLN